ncbi:hypothetical protein [Streptomyces sp. DSM 40750]|uniref:hypothetical protein n=1 Tax=Streptomyces sp. DSM 40750 TaxID=2801030 RepID=UPI00214CEA9D|nr:hypothetical protein [Streptomyces sp. DSM 40750]UUU21917.1 hypothetical protein JIX55_17155 [Streptomyces sp. DSM 40750]
MTLGGPQEIGRRAVIGLRSREELAELIRPELLHDVEDLLGRYLGDRILTSLSRVTASGPL